MGSLGVVAFAYAPGFIIQTLSSWCEGVLFLTWGGKPSDQLLDGKDIWKVRFYSADQVRNYLVAAAAELGQKNVTNDSLFEIAYREVNSRKYDRITNFNASYAFARSMTLAFGIATVKHLLVPPFNLKVTIILLTLLCISWYRAKQRGFYFTREVLNMYLVEKTNGIVKTEQFKGDSTKRLGVSLQSSKVEAGSSYK